MQDPDTYQYVVLIIGMSDYQPVLEKRESESSSPFLTNACSMQQGNKIYRWYYSSTSFPTESWATIDDIPNAEITTMAISPDESKCTWELIARMNLVKTGMSISTTRGPVV